MAPLSVRWPAHEEAVYASYAMPIGRTMQRVGSRCLLPAARSAAAPTHPCLSLAHIHRRSRPRFTSENGITCAEGKSLPARRKLSSRPGASHPQALPEPCMTVSRLLAMRAHCDAATDVVYAENSYSREALVSMVGPTVSMIGCQRWRQSWFGGRSPCWSGRRHGGHCSQGTKPYGVDHSIVSRL